MPKLLLRYKVLCPIDPIKVLFVKIKKQSGRMKLKLNSLHKFNVNKYPMLIIFSRTVDHEV